MYKIFSKTFWYFWHWNIWNLLILEFSFFTLILDLNWLSLNKKTDPSVFVDSSNKMLKFIKICLIPRNVYRHSVECLATFPGMFKDIPRNVWEHSPESLLTFPGIFEDIVRNVCRHSPECLTTFPGMFGDIPLNITFAHSPCCPHSVPGSCIPDFMHMLYIMWNLFTVGSLQFSNQNRPKIKYYVNK